jgi:hypothetical protein
LISSQAAHRLEGHRTACKCWLVLGVALAVASGRTEELFYRHTLILGAEFRENLQEKQDNDNAYSDGTPIETLRPLDVDRWNVGLYAQTGSRKL